MMYNAKQLPTHCLLILLAFLTVTGCKTTLSSNFVASGKAIRVDRPIFDIKGVRLSDSTVKLSFISPSPLRTNDRAFRWVEAAIGPDADHLNDTIMFDPSVAGTQGVDATLQFIGDATWDTPAARRSDRAVADVSVVTSSDHLVFRTVIEYGKADPMLLIPFANPIISSTDNSKMEIEVGVIAKRVYVAQGEYLPTSETFRVLISDSKGSIVWRSDAGLAFLSIVTSVEPQTTNAVQRYFIPWTGVDLSGNQVSDGDYRVELIIPCRPTAYSASTTFAWPPR